MKKTYIIKPDMTLESPPAESCPLRIRVIRGFHLIKRKVFLRKFKTIYKQATDQGCTGLVTNLSTSPLLTANINASNFNSIRSVTVKNSGLGFTKVPLITIKDTFITGRNATAFARLGIQMIDIREAGSGYSNNPVLTYTVNVGINLLSPPVLEPVITNGKFTSVRVLNPGIFQNEVESYSAPIGLVIKITDATGTKATLKAYLGITEIIISNGGVNYTNPEVIFDSTALTDTPEQKAKGVANLNSGSLESLTLLHGGFGYTSNPSVTFQDTAGINGLASSDLEVLQIAITNAGQGYNQPMVTIENGGGNQIIFGNETSSNAGKLDTVVVTKAGSGYDEPPLITIEGRAILGMPIQANETIVSIPILNRGYGYNSAPKITISSREGHGTGAEAVATIGQAVKGYITKDSNGVLTSIAIYDRGEFLSKPTITIRDNSGGGINAKADLSLTVKKLKVESQGSKYEKPFVIIDTASETLFKEDASREFLVKYNGYSKRYPELTRLFELPFYGSSTMSQGVLKKTVGNIQTYEFTGTCNASFYHHTVAYDIVGYATATYVVEGTWDTDQKTYTSAVLKSFEFETNVGLYDNLNGTFVTFQYYLPRNLGKGAVDSYNDDLAFLDLDFGIPAVKCVDIFILTDYCFHFYPKPVQKGNTQDPNYIENQFIPQNYRPVLIVGKLVANQKFLGIFIAIYGIDSIEIRERYSI